MKKIALMTLIALLLILSACSGPGKEGVQVEIMDPVGGSSILTAVALEAFINSGESNVATLSASISMEDIMLCITKERGDITIEGNGFTLDGTGECVIRLEDGCSLTLNNVTVYGGSDAIGCLGYAQLGGINAVLKGVSNALQCNGTLRFVPNSDYEITGSNGCGIMAKELILGEAAAVSATGTLGGVEVANYDITLAAGSTLEAYTAESYNALKCGGTLYMQDGSTLIVENSGQYHGASVTALCIEGVVNIRAKGGQNATGLFLFEHTEDISVVGSCEPAARFESGKGSIAFVSDASKIQATGTNG